MRRNSSKAERESGAKPSSWTNRSQICFSESLTGFDLPASFVPYFSCLLPGLFDRLLLVFRCFLAMAARSFARTILVDQILVEKSRLHLA